MNGLVLKRAPDSIARDAMSFRIAVFRPEGGHHGSATRALARVRVS